MQLQRLFRLGMPLFVILAMVLALVPQVALADCGVYHTVLSGQNLYRISLRYGVNMYDVAAANGIADVSRIYAGQKLYIPCAGGTTPGAGSTVGATVVTTSGVTSGVNTTTATLTTTIIPAPGTQVVDCTGFRATSPLDGFPDGGTTFYWDLPRSPVGVEIYQVIVLDDRGRRVGSFDTAGGIYSTYGNVSFNEIGGRTRFSWYVVALAGGAEVCRTQVATVTRAWNPYAGVSP